MTRGLSLSLLACLTATSGCLPTVDVDKSDVAGYTDWYSVLTTGPAPGHGDGVRIIYANDAARSHAPGSTYPLGTVLVKEIYLGPADDPGPIDYIAIMRKLDRSPPGGELDEGWLFTFFDGGDVNAAEKHWSGCWSSCHVAAPFDGVFLEYGESATIPPP